MPRLRDAEHALNLAATFSRQPYICKSCRARQFHSSPALPFINRIRESLFGSEESQEAKKKREEQIQQKVEEQARRDAGKTSLETKVDRRGREYEVAAIYDPSINPEYVMSTNWDGLRQIGNEKWIKNRADSGEKYVGFMPKKRTQLNDVQWQQLLHHITVETLALEAAGRDLNDISRPRAGPGQSHQTSKTTIKSDEATDNVLLEFSSAESQEETLSYISASKSQHDPSLLPQDLANATSSSVSLQQYQEGTPWMDMRLRNPLVKLAIVKRVTQLTGHRIPDPAISNASTLRDLYMTLKTKEPPKKLAHVPELQRLETKAPNVAVHSRRRTPIDKEKEIGRWKIIEDELIARDLPVTGSRWIDAKPRTGVKMAKQSNRA